MPNAITDNAPAFIGLVRALLIFLTVWGVKITQAQQDATLNLLMAALPIMSLVFTAWTVAVSVPKTPSTAAAPLQTPPPGTALVTTAVSDASGVPPVAAPAP